MNADTSISNIANIERLHALMDRDGLSAVVLRSGTNFTYLAGFDYAGNPRAASRFLRFSARRADRLAALPSAGSRAQSLCRRSRAP